MCRFQLWELGLLARSILCDRMAPNSVRGRCVTMVEGVELGLVQAGRLQNRLINNSWLVRVCVSIERDKELFHSLRLYSHSVAPAVGELLAWWGRDLYRWSNSPDDLTQWFPASLMLTPFNTVPRVVETPKQKIILLLLRNSNFSTLKNCNINIWYTDYLICDPQRSHDPQIGNCWSNSIHFWYHQFADNLRPHRQKSIGWLQLLDAVNISKNRDSTTEAQNTQARTEEWPTCGTTLPPRFCPWQPFPKSTSSQPLFQPQKISHNQAQGTHLNRRVTCSRTVSPPRFCPLRPFSRPTLSQLVPGPATPRPWPQPQWTSTTEVQIIPATTPLTQAPKTPTDSIG